jgi:Asp-tRNA(Asn)/Glu-tRNA(Gln) amidotransferase A subunit family amidase
MSGSAIYDLKPVRAPRLRGSALRLATTLLEHRVIRALAAPLLARVTGLADLRAAEINEPPSFLPLHAGERATAAAETTVAASRGPGFRFRGIRDYEAAYRAGITTAEQVGERVLEAIAASDRSPAPLRAFISWDAEDVRKQARAAAERWRSGRPLGPLDGVPIAVKDEIDLVPYPTTAGTRFLGSRKVTSDSTVAARLRSAGALLIGKTNMHEIGILPNGVNPHHGTVRNPYDPTREAGGSSSGSAAALAAGLCAAAIGADGGGSIRIPAAFCGIVGLKPTFGRVSEFGAVPLAWSVAHLGPLATLYAGPREVSATMAGGRIFRRVRASALDAASVAAAFARMRVAEEEGFEPPSELPR